MNISEVPNSSVACLSERNRSKRTDENEKLRQFTSLGFPRLRKTPVMRFVPPNARALAPARALSLRGMAALHRFGAHRAISRACLVCVCALALASSALAQTEESTVTTLTPTPTPASFVTPAPAQTFGRVVINEIMYNERKGDKKESKASTRAANVGRARARAEAAAGGLADLADATSNTEEPVFSPGPAPSFDDSDLSDDQPLVGGDWIELHNPGEVAIDIGGWTLRGSKSKSSEIDDAAADDDAFVFPKTPETILEPGAFLVVARDVAKFMKRYPDLGWSLREPMLPILETLVKPSEAKPRPRLKPSEAKQTKPSKPTKPTKPSMPSKPSLNTPLTTNQTSPSLLNASFEFNLSAKGETVLLYDTETNLVDFVEYDDKKGWPTEADGFGFSLELIDPTKLDRNDPFSWTNSFAFGGSPGRENDAARNARGGIDGDDYA